MTDNPLVSIIVPCYNEQATVTAMMEAVRLQTYPAEKIELVIADGFSTDQTRKCIRDYMDDYPGLKICLVDNPKQTIPAGLNVAVNHSKGDVIIRMDAHSKPHETYIERCVQALESRRGDNVGGIWEIRPGGIGWMAKSIAFAAAHPFGVGDARYRHASQAQLVDTVPFGAFRRSLIQKIGAFDETLLTNEDYEFNVRVRKAGGKIWLDPAIRSIYFARSDIHSLAKQYWRYGFWKWLMLKRYPKTFRWRQVSGIFVLSLIILGLLAIKYPVAGWLLLWELIMYVLSLLLAGIQLTITSKDIRVVIGVPIAIATMHFSWGSAFLWSMIRSSFKSSRNE